MFCRAIGIFDRPTGRFIDPHGHGVPRRNLVGYEDTKAFIALEEDLLQQQGRQNDFLARSQAYNEAWEFEQELEQDMRQMVDEAVNE